MTRVACIGEAMIELSIDGATAQVGVAGDTLNTAIYLHRNAPDIAVDYITRLGDDPFSGRIRAFVASQGVGGDRIAIEPGGSPGLYAITTSDTGERTFTYWRSASAARGLFQTGTGGCDFSALEGYDLLYLSGITLAILPPHVRLALIGWLNATGVRLAFDSNHRPRLWEDQATARAANAALWERADIALPSIDDEMALWDQPDDQVIARFAALGVTGAVKRGAKGPVSLGPVPVDQVYPPVKNVIDTTAAGDSFNGAYLAAILTGKPQDRALMAAHRCAAAVVQHRGAIMPAGGSDTPN